MPPSVTLLPVTYDPNEFVSYVDTNFTRLETAVESAESNLPINSIILWYGTPATVPTGWAICDGTNGTPNLKGRTPVGVDAAQTEFDVLGETGGAKTVALSTAELAVHGHTQNSHNHTQDNHNHTAGSHSHTYGTDNQGYHDHAVDGDYGLRVVITHPGGVDVMGVASGGTQVRSTVSTLDPNGSHTHSGTTNPNSGSNTGATATNQGATATNQNAGSGTAHNNLQPYLALYFIMKIV